MQPNSPAATATIGLPPFSDGMSEQDALGARFLRPQTLGSIFRNTAVLYCRNFKTIGLIYILPLLPLSLLRNLYQESLDPDQAVVVLLFVIEFLGGLLIGAALVIAVSDICVGVRPSLRRSYRRGFANRRLIGTYLLTMLSIGGGFLLFVVPGMIFAAWWMFIISVIVLENIGGRAAMRRSKELGRGYYLRNAGIIFSGTVGWLILTVVTGGAVGGVVGLVGAILEIDVLWLLHFLGAVIGVAMGPLISIPLTLLYYDMRARKEGYGAAQLVEDLRI